MEDAARGFIQEQIRAELADLFEDPQGHDPDEAFVVLRESLIMEGSAAAAELRRKVIDGLTTLTARLCKLDCEEKKGLRAWLQKSIKVQAERLNVVMVKTAEAAQRRYDEMVARLIHDLRIFSATNFGAFLLLSFAFRAVRERPSLIILPVGLLLPATLFAICLYLFGQDWFYTLVYDDHVGTGYLAYIGVTYLFLFDLCFLHGTITQMVLNAIGAAINAILRVLSHCIPSF